MYSNVSPIILNTLCILLVARISYNVHIVLLVDSVGIIPRFVFYQYLYEMRTLYCSLVRCRHNHSNREDTIG